MSESEIYTNIKEEFKQRFAKNVNPMLENYEKERLSLIKSIKNTSIAIVVITLILTVVFRMGPFAFYVFLAATIIALLHIYIGKNFENEIKSKIFPLICQNIGNIQQSDEFGAHILQYREANLVPAFDNENLYVSYIGDYNDFAYDIVKCELKLEVKLNKKSDNESVFTGNIIRINLNNYFAGNTVYKTKPANITQTFGELKYTNINQVYSENNYDVFTDNETEARSLITPEFCELINNIKTAFGAKNASAAFYKDFLFIALDSSPEIFAKPSLKHSLKDYQQYKNAYDKFLSVMKLIDYFKNKN